MPNQYIHPIICFGEVLWDVLPTGAEPGGAPMNVAYHLKKQGKDAAVITKIGNDAKGKELIDVYAGYGVCTDFFQQDPTHRTGEVFAQPNELNEVAYNIVKPVAWDFIEWRDEYAALVAEAGHFVFGSLAARSEVSRKTLFQLLESANKRVLDINLRAPHFSRTIVEELISKADFLKLNLAELEMISDWLGRYHSVDDRIRLVTDHFKISDLVVTLGGDGAILCSNDVLYRQHGFPVTVVDTVGSGDAFLAGLLSNRIDGTAPAEALRFACGLGSFIATQKGGCPPYSNEALQAFIYSKK